MNALQSDLLRALDRFDEALRCPIDLWVVQAGAIQAFEFSFELAWKWLQARLREEGIEARSPRECLRQAQTLGWLGDDGEVWLGMLAARNQMSHTYDVERAVDVYRSLDGFLGAMRRAVAARSQAR